MFFVTVYMSHTVVIDRYEEVKAKNNYVCDDCGLIKYIYGSVYSLLLGWE
jgi:hypothetical protein